MLRIKPHACALALVLLCAPLHAQQEINHATLHGQVLDPSGAIIVNATINAHNLDTGATTTTHTAESGFHLEYLTPGRYELQTNSPGFSPDLRATALTAGQDSAINITLKIGNAETIDDFDPPLAMLNTDATSLTTIAAPAPEITSIPLLSRNVLDLALLAPGVSATNTASTQLFAETSAVPGQGLSLNSQRNFSNAFLLDGLSVGDDASGLLQTAIPLDAISQLNVVTAGGQTEFGRALGGYLSFQTKAGTNTLHGDAFAFLRNQRLNAANALSQSTIPMTQTLFGASLAGPVIHDHAWLFLAAEQRNLNQNGLITIKPTDAASINATLLTQRYPGQLLTVPTSATTLYPNPSHATNVFARFDQRLNERETFFARYSFYKVASQNSRNVGALAATSAGAALYDADHNIALSNIFVFTANTMNETRAQFTHSLLDAPANDPIGPAVSISGVATFGTLSGSPTARYDNLFELVDNLSHTRGRHAFRAGADFLSNNLTITFPQSIRGNYAFSSLTNFTAGKYTTFTQSFGNPIVPQTNPNLGLYVQDEFRAGPTVTLNAGLRYDLQFLNAVTTATANLSPRLGISWQPFPNQTIVRASYGLFYDRVPLRALSNALESNGNSTTLNANTFVTLALQYGQAGAPAFPAIDTGYTAANIPANLRLSLTTMDPAIHNAVAQQGSLAIEQRLAPTTTLTLTYQHVRGEHLLVSVNLNTPTCPAAATGVYAGYTGPVDPINLCRPIAAYANNKQYRSAADSSYDALTAALVRRYTNLSSGTSLSYRLSYAWSHALDDVGEFFFSAPINNSRINEDYARSDDDQRHRLALDFVLATTKPGAPFMPALGPGAPSMPALGHGWAATNLYGVLTHNWQLSTVLQYTSKLPFNLVTGGTTIQTTTQRPCAPGYSLTATNGVNPCTLALPGAVISRNTGTGFDFFNLNARLTRTIPLTETLKLEALAEAFNALNHRNNQVPNATFGTAATPLSTLGAPTATADARSLQLALRLTF